MAIASAPAAMQPTAPRTSLRGAFCMCDENMTKFDSELAAQSRWIKHVPLTFMCHQLHESSIDQNTSRDGVEDPVRDQASLTARVEARTYAETLYKNQNQAQDLSECLFTHQSRSQSAWKVHIPFP